jgi:hypothetical protein
MKEKGTVIGYPSRMRFDSLSPRHGAATFKAFDILKIHLFPLVCGIQPALVLKMYKAIDNLFVQRAEGSLEEDERTRSFFP